MTGKDVYLQMTWSWPDKTWNILCSYCLQWNTSQSKFRNHYFLFFICVFWQYTVPTFSDLGLYNLGSTSAEILLNCKFQVLKPSLAPWFSRWRNWRMSWSSLSSVSACLLSLACNCSWGICGKSVSGLLTGATVITWPCSSITQTSMALKLPTAHSTFRNILKIQVTFYISNVTWNVAHNCCTFELLRKQLVAYIILVIIVPF